MKHEDFYNKKRVLVTGYTGFKGGWLTKTLMLLGARVAGYSNVPEYQPNLNDILGLSKEIPSYSYDITNFVRLKECIEKEKPELIFHLAAQISGGYDDPIQIYRTNVLGTLNVLEAARQTKSVKAIIVITTDKVYQNHESLWPFRETDPLGGNDPYSSSKACVELMVNAFRDSLFKEENAPAIATARAGNVIGGGDWAQSRIIPDVVKSVFEQESPVQLRSPDAVRPWQHVLPVVDGYLLLGKKLYEDKVEFSSSWNFAPENENLITVSELVRKAIGILKKGTYEVQKATVRAETKVLQLDPSKAKMLLGWTNAFPLDEALKLTFQWYRAFYEKQDVKQITESQITNFFKNGNPT